MLNIELGSSLYWLSKKSRRWTIWRENLPDSVIIGLGSNANLLVSRESSKDFWGALSGVEVKWFVEDVRVSYETYRLTIFDNFLRIWVFSTLNENN